MYVNAMDGDKRTFVVGERVQALNNSLKVLYVYNQSPYKSSVATRFHVRCSSGSRFWPVWQPMGLEDFIRICEENLAVHGVFKEIETMLEWWCRRE